MHALKSKIEGKSLASRGKGTFVMFNDDGLIFPFTDRGEGEGGSLSSFSSSF